MATLDCEAVIEQSIRSFAAQDYEKKELIIVDGASSDGTLSIIEKYRPVISVLISEKDEGIYDAYNKGVECATGEYVLFLGADDSFCNRHTLSKVASYIAKKNAPDLLSTSIFYIDKGWAYIEKKTALYSWKKGIAQGQPMIPHQGLYTKTAILREHPFRTDYEICADLEFYLYCCKSGKRIEYLEKATAFFDRQGISSTKWTERAEEENMILSSYGEKVTEDNGKSPIRRKIRQWIIDRKWGTVLLIRFRGFRIHRCGNEQCRWCDHNRKMIRG